MHRASSFPFPGPNRGRRLFSKLGAAALVVACGCAEFAPTAVLQPRVVRAAAEVLPELPAPRAVENKPLPAARLAEPAPGKVLPISLDTVLQLAQDQNGQIHLARERLQEAFAARDVAAKRWLPDVYVGTAFYRHEGGIQNPDGTFVHSSFGALFGGLEICGHFDVRDLAFQKIDAERKIWQQRGELSKLTSENLLDAASTYVDLLAAQSGAAVAVTLQGYLQELLGRAKKLADIDPGAEVEVERIDTELAAQQQVIRKLREAATAAAAKLVYLLGLDPCSEFVLLDRQLAPFYLVDATAPACDLVTQALATGPGIRELEGLLALIQESSERAKGLVQYLPVFEVKMAEGAFGAGPGDSLTWDNRWDLGLQMRWNLTELATARDRKRVAQSKIQQAQLTYQDLRGKLTAGVQEAREASLSGEDQVRFSRVQIEHAQKAYERSNYRLINNIKGRSPSEVLLAIRALGGAQLNYLNAVRDHDKAQLRLLALLGRVGDGNCPK
jgi:outer membrane protein TolC